MGAAAELGRNPVGLSIRFSLSMEMSTRRQILRRERGQGNIIFSCSADHEQDWQPYSVDPYSCYMLDHTCIHRLASSHHEDSILFAFFLNASRPSEHPPVGGGEMSKCLGGIIGCKDKTSYYIP